jgi:NAD(P)-dependent dehydrogenase (short-subunit alcohol dehydrogenase family)
MATAMDQASRFSFRLDGKTVFLSGAAGHLGRAMAFAFAQAGAHVIVNGRTAATLEALAGAIVSAGGGASVAVFDVTDRAAADAFLGGLPMLHVLVNNAISGLGGKDPGAEIDQFRGIVESGLVASHANIMAALPSLQAAAAEAGQASVINIASQWGHVSPDFRMYEDCGLAPTPPQYGATKAGLMQLTRYLAVQLAPQRIRVNSVSPGIFPWPSIAAEQPAFIARACDRSPMARLGEAHELAGPVVFLASNAASYVTGADLRVDGGWTAR